MPTPSLTRRGLALKKVIIALAAIVVILVTAVILLVPPIASSYITGRHEIDLPSGRGAVEVRDVSISWGGPQRVGKIVLTDTKGQPMADLTAETRKSLLSAVFDGGNIGTVSISGSIDVTEEQLAAAPGAAPAPAGPSTPSAPAKPTSIPDWLNVRLEARPINITYTPRAGSGLSPVKIDGLETIATFSGSGQADIDVTAKSPTINVKGSARNFVDSSGELALSSAEGELNATIAAPGELVEAIARLALNKAASPSSTSAGAAPTELSAHLKVASGRLRLADPSKPVTAKGPVPQAIIEMLAGPDAAVALADAPSITKTISALDLPLPDASGKVDLRGGSLRAAIVTSPVVGEVALAGAAAKPFRVEPLDFEIASTDFAQALTMKARTRGSFDGRDAGSLELDADVQGLLDDTGMIRAGVPGRVNGTLALKDVPTRLADSFASNLGFSLAEVIGPSLTAEAKLATAEASAGAALPPARLTANIRADHLTAALAADINDSRLLLSGDGLTVNATRLAPAIRAFTKDQPFVFSGEGRLNLVAREVSVPLISGGLPDLGRLAANITVGVSDLVIEQGAGDRPLQVKNLETALILAAEGAPRLTMQHELASGGRPFTATGGFELPGLITRRDKEWPFIELTPETLRPSGSLQITGLPSDILGYVPSEMRESAERALGPDLNITIEGTREPSGTTDLRLALAGEGIDATGAFVLDDQSIRSKDQGLRATIKRPGPLVQSFLQRQPNSTVAGVDWSTPLTIEVPTLAAAIPAKGQPFALDQVEASARLRADSIAMDVRPGAASTTTERITAESLDASFALTKAEGASIKINSIGAHQSQRFTIAGDLALGKVLGPAGVDLAALMPKGTIEAKGVPTALIAAFDSSNGPIIRDAAGPHADLTLTAPASASAEGAVTGPRSASLALRSPNLTADSSFAIADKTVSLGQTAVALTMTPALIQSATAQYAPDLSPRPSLQKNARVNLTVFPTSIDMDQSNQPDMNTLRPVRAMLTSPDDIVLMNLPGGGEGKPMNAGLRGVEAGLTWNQQDLRKREGSLKARLFEPSEPEAVIAEVEAGGMLINPPPTFNAKIDRIDTARVDRLLGRPGLLADLMGDAAGIGATGSARAGVQDIELDVKSQRLNTKLTLQNTKDALRLTTPGVVDVNVPAAWANRYVFAPAPDGTPAPIQLADAVQLNMKLQRFAIAPGETPLKPGIFTLEASASAPTLRLRTADNQNVDIQALSANLTSNDAKRSIAFDVNTSQVAIAGAGGSNPVRAVGEIANIADDSGRLAAESAALTAKVTGTLPTAVIDALGNQQGMLVDLLGKMTKIELDAQGLSKQAGTLSANVNTDNAKAGVRGSVRDQTFITEGPTNITLSRVTQELSKRFFETTIPIISKVEKTADDEPAVINATGLTVPTDGDTRKINGVAQVDLGTLRYNTSSFFGELVKIAGGRDSGQVGKRIKPFEFVAKNGVVSYEKIELPLGEFNINTRGKVDLNTRKMDVVTFVPFTALAEELAGAVKNIPGVEALTMIPIRTHGPIDNPKSEIQMDLIVKEALPGALEKVIPEDIKKVIPPEIGEGLKDLFKKKKKE